MLDIFSVVSKGTWVCNREWENKGQESGIGSFSIFIYVWIFNKNAQCRALMQVKMFGEHISTIQLDNNYK